MLYYDRIDVNKTSVLKKCDICGNFKSRGLSFNCVAIY